MRRILLLGLLGGALGTVSSCGAGLQGARVIQGGYAPQVVTEYRAEGDAPMGARYALIRDGEGVAMFRSLPGQQTVVISPCWRDRDGEHFVMWWPGTTAEEILVPPTPGAAAFRWTYPPGLYEVKSVSDIQRPVPKIPLEAVTKLTPVGVR